MDHLEMKRVEDYDEELRLVLNLSNRLIHHYSLIFETFLEINNIVFDEDEKENIRELTSNLKFVINELIVFLKISDYRHYILSIYERRTLRAKLSRLSRGVVQRYHSVQAHYPAFNKEDVLEILEDISDDCNDFYDWLDSYSQFIRTQDLHDKKIDFLNSQIANSQAELHRINSQRTELIYSQASVKYLEYARNYEWAFYLIFFGAVVLTIVSFVHFPHKSTDIVDYVLYKVLTLSIVVTTGTIFLRKASHLRKLHDQANQTSLELQALPMFLRNIDESEHSEIYKNLADKYFGKELDQTQNDKIGDLMQDQILAGTELIKASAEMVRSVKPNSNQE